MGTLSSAVVAAQALTSWAVAFGLWQSLASAMLHVYSLGGVLERPPSMTVSNQRTVWSGEHLASLIQSNAATHSTPLHAVCFEAKELYLQLTTNIGLVSVTAWCGLQAAQDKSWQMNAIDISQTMRGLANMRLGSRLLVQSLVHRAATILDTFNPQVCAILCPAVQCCCLCVRVYSLVKLAWLRTATSWGPGSCPIPRDHSAHPPYLLLHQGCG